MNKAIGGKGDPAHAPLLGRAEEAVGGRRSTRGWGSSSTRKGLDAEKAYRETLDALVEQMTVRIGSVDNGEKYMKEKGARRCIPMPEGPKIFETIGPWEDYATPSRDMRLIIAMNVLLALPDRVVKHPELYNLAGRSPRRCARDRQAARQPDRRRAASPTRAATAAPRS